MITLFVILYCLILFVMCILYLIFILCTLIVHRLCIITKIKNKMNVTYALVRACESRCSIVITPIMKG